MSSAAKQLRSPARVMLSVAGALFISWVAARVLGWREFTTTISATMPPDGVDFAGAAARGSAYLAAYFAALIITPTLCLAAALEWTWRQWQRLS